MTLFWSLQPLENLDLTETLLVFVALEMLGITETLSSADFEKACGYPDTFLVLLAEQIMISFKDDVKKFGASATKCITKIGRSYENAPKILLNLRASSRAIKTRTS